MNSRFFTELRQYRIRIAAVLLVIIFGSVLILSNIIPPSDFPRNLIVKIPAGTTISGAAKILKEAGIIRSVNLYKLFVYISHSPAGVQIGDYLFENAEFLPTVAHRTAFGEQNIQKIKVTIPEGSNTGDIAKILSKSIPDFNSSLFISMARQYEGYLFPETYYFFQNVTPEQVIHEMRSVFDDNIENIQDKIDVSGIQISDIITMASIIEKEASKDEDRGIISGILWKRIKTGMPLQVDAPFYYELNKTSGELTTSDLKTDSPYNTYTRKGLPVTPITNPGIKAIQSAISPETSKYWFFLSDKNGVMHYAITHDEHVLNKVKYLK